MGKHFFTRNRILAAIWYLKVFIALSFGIGGLALLVTQTAAKYREAHLKQKQQLERAYQNVSIPISIDPNNALCQVSNSKLARLEPPAGKVYVGFHLVWETQSPEEVGGILQKNPAIL
jgi:hypothetical protein